MSWSRGQINDIVATQAAKNPKYRETLMKDPHMVLSKQLGTEIPKSTKIKVVEETADTVYVVLPYVAKEGAELGDADLEKVAGGLGDKICIASVLSTQVDINF
jgi:hypothetical protein